MSVSLSQEDANIITRMAKRDQISRASKITQLLRQAIELEEDMYFSALGDARLAEKNIRWISHKEAWGL